MLQTNQMMAKASRQIISELNKYADAAHVQGFLIPAHVYMCDYMAIKYNQSVVINAIKSHIGKIPPNKREYKHFTPLYWYKVIDDMFGNNINVMRCSDTVYGEMVDYNSFNHITSMFMVADYSAQDALLINNIVNTVPQTDIVTACLTASQNGVHSIQYVKAILDNAEGERRVKEQHIKQLGIRIEKSSDILLGGETHTHTIMDLAAAEYDYNKKSEAALLEQLFKKVTEGKK